MPEYLSPGVYIEEIETGPVPIQGVSTSTGGMVGLAQRGPIDQPTLCTSYGDFTRIFGNPLDPAAFAGANLHAGFNALAFAVEGFFLNGGTRVWIDRVSPPNPPSPNPPIVVRASANVSLQGGGGHTLTVSAVDPGAWANSAFGVLNGRYQQTDGLRITFGQDLGASAAVQAVLGSVYTLTSVLGIYIGAVLKGSHTGVADDFQAVSAVNATTKQVTTFNSFMNGVASGDSVQLVEFSITSDLLAAGSIVQSETFHNLTAYKQPAMLSNFVESVIGIPSATLQRTPGASNLIRVVVTPEAAYDTDVAYGPAITPTLALAGGADGLSSTTVDQSLFWGTQSDDPAQRTGVNALLNVRDISIVAIPGQTDPQLLDNLLAMCENARYRFAIVDTAMVTDVGDWHAADAAPPDVLVQRGNYDSKYGALYYPWLAIEDPFPANPANVAPVYIPPSGHIMGIYARSDIDRGVFKAPANEIVNGAIAFSHGVDQPTQDTLNPIGINALRDFRAENRGLRVWGARTLSSDAQWKYVNIRRLFIFLEASIEYGTQWVVFEPNNELLWARVRQSVSEFLTDVWRTGALMGTKPDEAFYVWCDRTTMTQSDLENGRLIVEIGVAPTYPAEFVIFRITQWAGPSGG